MSELVVSSLTKNIGSKQSQICLFDCINFSISLSQITVLMGVSGSGKSTLCRILCGLDKDYSGDVRLKDSNDFTICAIQLVPQELHLFQWLTVEQHIEFGHRCALDKRSGYVEYLLDLMALGPKRKCYPHELSGGMKQRLALARALAVRPRFVVLDENFNALDWVLKEQLMLNFCSIKKELGFGALIVTHNPHEAAFLADRVLLLSPKLPSCIYRDINLCDNATYIDGDFQRKFEDISRAVKL